MKLTKFEDTLHQRLRDPDYAQAYLQAALSEGGKSEWLLALKEVAAASEGGFSKVAEKADLGRESMYKALSGNGNPRWSTVVSVLDAVGFELKIEKKEPAKGDRSTESSQVSSREYWIERGYACPPQLAVSSYAAKPLRPGARNSSGGVYNLVGSRGGTNASADNVKSAAADALSKKRPGSKTGAKGLSKAAASRSK